MANIIDVNVDVVEQIVQVDNCCSICYVDFEPSTCCNNKCTTICGHSFHTGCLLQNGLYRNECPMCRHVLVEVPDASDDDENDDDYDDDEDDDTIWTDDDDDDEDGDEDCEEDDVDDNGNRHPVNYWMPAKCLWNNLLRLNQDAHNSDLRNNLKYGPKIYNREYCRKKYYARYGVIHALGHLSDEEWGLAENEILKTVSKFYGKKKEAIWDDNESIGLANNVLFNN